MAYRSKMSRSSSKKNFRRGAKVHKKNLPQKFTRGGIRF